MNKPFLNDKPVSKATLLKGNLSRVSKTNLR